jgi:hypothetical protein
LAKADDKVTKAERIIAAAGFPLPLSGTAAAFAALDRRRSAAYTG